MKLILISCLLILSSCSHFSRCGNPEGARTIYLNERGCKVRVRQVTIGSELNVPESLKSANLAQFKFAWIKPIVKDGHIVLGHFALIPNTEEEE